jgi:hypothetical protein
MIYYKKITFKKALESMIKNKQLIDHYLKIVREEYENEKKNT